MSEVKEETPIKLEIPEEKIEIVDNRRKFDLVSPLETPAWDLDLAEVSDVGAPLTESIEQVEVVDSVESIKRLMLGLNQEVAAVETEETQEAGRSMSDVLLPDHYRDMPLEKEISSRKIVTVFEPLHSNVLVRFLSERQAGTIIQLDQYEAKPQVGVVMAVGPGLLMKDGTRFETVTKPDDVVMIQTGAGWKVKLDGISMTCCKEAEILGIIGKIEFLEEEIDKEVTNQDPESEQFGETTTVKETVKTTKYLNYNEWPDYDLSTKKNY